MATFTAKRVSVTKGSKIVVINSGENPQFALNGDFLIVGGNPPASINRTYQNELNQYVIELNEEWAEGDQSYKAAVLIPTTVQFRETVETLRNANTLLNENTQAMQDWQTKLGTVTFINIDGTTSEIRTIKQIEADLDYLRPALVQGRVPYQTYASLVGSGAPENDELAEVWNDPVPANNGVYGYANGTWTKALYQDLATANNRQDIEQLTDDLSAIETTLDKSFSAIEASNPTITGFDDLVIAGSNFSANVAPNVNAYTRWELITPLAEGESLTLNYLLSYTGNNVIVWLGDGAAANQSGGNIALQNSAAISEVILTATGSARYLYIQQVTNVLSSIDISFIAFNSETKNQSNNVILQKALNQQGARLTALDLTIENIQDELRSKEVVDYTAPFNSGYSDLSIVGNRISGEVSAGDNAYTRWALIEPLSAGQTLSLSYVLTLTGNTMVAWLGDGAAVEKSGGTIQLENTGELKTIDLTATGTATHLYLQQITNTNSSHDLIFKTELKGSELTEFSDLTTQALTNTKSAINALSLKIDEALVAEDFAAVNYETPLISGYDDVTVYKNRVQGEVLADGNGYTRWRLLEPLTVGQSVRLSYVLNATGNGVLAWLADGAAANKSGGNISLNKGGALEQVELTATGTANYLYIQQITNTPSTIDIAFLLEKGYENAEGATDLTAQVLANQSALLANLSDQVFGPEDGSGSGVLSEAPPFTTGYETVEATSNGVVSTTLSGGNGYTYWSLATSFEPGDEITLYYQLTYTGNAPQLWLTNKAFANASGGTKSLVGGGSLESITLTASEAASRLIIQQYTTSDSTLDFNFIAFGGDSEANDLQKKTIELFTKNFQVQAQAMATLKTDVTDLIANFTPSLPTGSGSTSEDSKNRYLVSSRNGVMITTSGNTSQSIRRKITNGSIAMKNIEVSLANWHVTPSGEEIPDNDEIQVRVSIEYPIGTKPQHLKVDGLSQIIIPAGRTVTAKDSTGLILPAGESFYLHTYVEAYKNDVVAGRLPVGRFYVHWSSSRDMYEKNGSDLTNVIGGQSTGTAAPADLYSHLAITGEAIYNDAKPSLLILSDSIGYGFNEHLAMKGDNNGAVGPYERWAAKLNVGSLNLSVPSKRASDWAKMAAGDYPRVASLINGLVNISVLALGRNDLSSQTASQLISSLKTIETFLQNTFNIPSFPITVTPASSSNDGWATVEGQTANVNDAERITYNNHVRSLVNYLEVSSAIESGSSGKWLAGSLTSDGVHPSTNAVELLVESFPSAISYIDPEEPTDPVDPEEPTDPVDPEEPTDPVDPEEPTDPVDPEEPTEPAIGQVARLDGFSQEWLLSGDIVLNPTDNYKVRMKVITLANDFFLICDKNTNDRLALYGGKFYGLFGTTLDSARVSDNLTHSFLITNDGVNSRSLYLDGDELQTINSTSEFTINSLGGLFLGNTSVPRMEGVIYEFEVEINGVVAHAISLTNKEQGATQLATVGSVNATMTNFTESVWKSIPKSDVDPEDPEEPTDPVDPETIGVNTWKSVNTYN